MPFVADCSVVARWFLPDEATRYSEAALDRLATDTAHVPALRPHRATGDVHSLPDRKGWSR